MDDVIVKKRSCTRKTVHQSYASLKTTKKKRERERGKRKNKKET